MKILSLIENVWQVNNVFQWPNWTLEFSDCKQKLNSDTFITPLQGP